MKPEDICVDKNGLIYTATRDGWIRRLHRNGTWENWKWFQSESLLGMTAAADGSIIVCDCDKVVRINPQIKQTFCPPFSMNLLSTVYILFLIFDNYDNFRVY